MSKPLKYVIYCRRSQDREDKQTLSVESQRRELLAHAKQHNLEVVEVIREDASAYKRGRVEFSRMMDLIESGKANAVLTWHLTRLARNGADGGMIISFMDESMIKELRTPEKTYLNTPDDKFMMTIHFAMAKKSSDDTSSFVKNNTKTKLIAGEYPGVAHYGYLNIDQNGVIAGKRFTNEKQAILESLGRPLKRIEQDPIEAPLIRRLIDLSLTSAYNLRQLQDEGFKLGLKGKQSGKMLSKQAVKDILMDQFLTGKFDWNDETIQGVHDPIMTSVEFERIHEILFRRSRPKNNKNEYTYMTLVHCPLCNNPMSGEFQKETHYYRCARAKGSRATCLNRKHIRQDVLDLEIEKTLLYLPIPSRILDWALTHLKAQYLEENKTLECRRSLLESNTRDEKAKLTRLTSKWLSPENADGGLIPDDEYKAQKEIIQKVIRNYEEQLGDVKGNEDGWLEKCEQFFMKLRVLPQQFNDEGLVGKRILLQSMGARFVRKNEEWLVELEKPFSLILEVQKESSLSELAESGLDKAKIGVSMTENSKWLPRLDSNQRPSG